MGNDSHRRNVQPRSRHHARRRALGEEGEERAARHLVGEGYRIVDRNVRAGGVEIDIVARRGSLLAFVEVKTRRSTRHGAPECSVDEFKRARLVRGASAWLAEHRASAARVRFDVIAWTVAPRREGGGEAWHLQHFEGAFSAGE